MIAHEVTRPAHIEALCDEMMAVNEQRQLGFEGTHYETVERIFDEGRRELRTRCPDREPIRKAILWDYKYLAALAGAGFTRQTDAPRDLRVQVDVDLSNENFEDIYDDQEMGYNSYGVRLLTREACMKTLEFAYRFVGPAAILSYEDSDMQAELQEEARGTLLEAVNENQMNLF